MHDAVQIEALGTPAALIITEPFVPVVASFAPTLGMESYPTNVLPHPVGTLDDDALAKLADSIVDQVEQNLIGT